MDITTKEAQPSPAQMQTYMQQWSKWIDAIEEKGLLQGGHHLGREGVQWHPENKSTQGPSVLGGQSVAGYILIQAESLRQASGVARRCPILKGENTSVEVREIAAPGN